MDLALLSLLAVVAVLMAAIVGLWISLRRARARATHCATAASDSQSRLADAKRLLTGDSYGGGITLRWHVQRLRFLARVLAQEGGALLERRPDLAWQLRALDDYLQSVAVATTGEALIDVRLQLDRHGYLYEETYMPLDVFIRRAAL